LLLWVGVGVGAQTLSPDLVTFLPIRRNSCKNTENSLTITGVGY
jgi:hypothetical protein